MNQEPKPSLPVPGWYWGIAVVALLWNLLGCMTFTMELVAQEEFMKSWTDEQ
jgi:hypothetical protein